MVGIISQFLFIRYLVMVFSDKAPIFPGLFQFCLIIEKLA